MKNKGKGWCSFSPCIVLARGAALLEAMNRTCACDECAQGAVAARKWPADISFPTQQGPDVVVTRANVSRSALCEGVRHRWIFCDLEEVYLEYSSGFAFFCCIASTTKASNVTKNAGLPRRPLEPRVDKHPACQQCHPPLVQERAICMESLLHVLPTVRATLYHCVSLLQHMGSLKKFLDFAR